MGGNCFKKNNADCLPISKFCVLLYCFFLQGPVTRGNKGKVGLNGYGEKLPWLDVLTPGVSVHLKLVSKLPL
jgi:hypothetical protein